MPMERDSLALGNCEKKIILELREKNVITII
jgi:hypothetical protein